MRYDLRDDGIQIVKRIDSTIICIHSHVQHKIYYIK